MDQGPGQESAPTPFVWLVWPATSAGRGRRPRGIGSSDETSAKGPCTDRGGNAELLRPHPANRRRTQGCRTMRIEVRRADRRHAQEPFPALSGAGCFGGFGGRKLNERPVSGPWLSHDDVNPPAPFPPRRGVDCFWGGSSNSAQRDLPGESDPAASGTLLKELNVEFFGSTASQWTKAWPFPRQPDTWLCGQ